MKYISNNLSIIDGVIYLTHGDIAFKDSKIYCCVNHTINHDDMSDADFYVDRNEINQIVINIDNYIIVDTDKKLHIGTSSIINTNLLHPNIYKITCTNYRCKLNEYFHLLNKNDIYVEIGVKYGAAASGILKYSQDNNLNLSINLFEKDENCCELLRKKFNSNVTIFEGDATQKLNELNKKFDFVFFDAHHHYKDDYPILQSLIPHLKESTIIIFDDYTYAKDVKKLVDEFKENYDFENIYTI